MSFELDLVPRVDLCATIFLTIVAQRISLAMALPETDTMTHIDEYLNLSIAFVVLAMVLNRLASTVGYVLFGDMMCCMEAISMVGKKTQAASTCTSICPETVADEQQQCVEQSLLPLGEMYRVLFFQTSENSEVFTRNVPENCVEVQTVKYFLMILWTALYLGFTISFFREWRRVRLKNRKCLAARREAALVEHESDPMIVLTPS